MAERLRKHKLSKEAYASLILEKTKQIIESHFGETAIPYLIPVKYQNKKVFINTKNIAWKQQIYPYKKSFCRLLQMDFPSEKIEDIILI